MSAPREESMNEEEMDCCPQEFDKISRSGEYVLILYLFLLTMMCQCDLSSRPQELLVSCLPFIFDEQ